MCICHASKNKIEAVKILPPPLLSRVKYTKTSFLECKENDQKLLFQHVKNVNKSKNRPTPVKLESKKQDKKVMDYER